MTEVVPDGVRVDDGDDASAGEHAGQDGDDASAGEHAGQDADDDHAMPAEDETDRLTRALHWAQQGSSPEVAQERWMRRIAGQSRQRLERDLTNEQVEDVAMVAAWVHAEAVAEGAALARKRMRRSAVVRLMTTALGAGIGALIAQIAAEMTVL